MEGIANVIDNKADAEYFKVKTRLNSPPLCHFAYHSLEHLRNLYLQVGGIRHLT